LPHTPQTLLHFVKTFISFSSHALFDATLPVLEDIQVHLFAPSPTEIPPKNYLKQDQQDISNTKFSTLSSVYHQPKPILVPRVVL